jgi:hypothetical protein
LSKRKKEKKRFFSFSAFLHSPLSFSLSLSLSLTFLPRSSNPKLWSNPLPAQTGDESQADTVLKNLVESESMCRGAFRCFFFFLCFCFFLCMYAQEIGRERKDNIDSHNRHTHLCFKTHTLHARPFRMSQALPVRLLEPRSAKSGCGARTVCRASRSRPRQSRSRPRRRRRPWRSCARGPGRLSGRLLGRLSRVHRARM